MPALVKKEEMLYFILSCRNTQDSVRFTYGYRFGKVEMENREQIDNTFLYAVEQALMFSRWESANSRGGFGIFLSETIAGSSHIPMPLLEL